MGRSYARVAVITTVALLAATFAQQASAAGTYVALGDSVAAGWGASDQATRGYVGVLGAALGVGTPFNFGVAAQTSTTLRGQQLTDALAKINDPSDTTLVTIDIGANDFYVEHCQAGWDTGCPLRANLAATLDDLLNALANDPGKETLATMAYYNPYAGEGTQEERDWDTNLFGANGVLNATDKGADVGVNDVILQESKKRGLPMANPYPYFEIAKQAWIANDRVHPNDDGHAAIAQTFCEVIPAHCNVFKLPGTGTGAPETTIDKAPKRKSGKRKVKVTFSSDARGASFECKLDKASFKPCTSPDRFRVKPGRHRFSVRSIDAAGNADPSPASARFRVTKKR